MGEESFRVPSDAPLLYHLIQLSLNRGGIGFKYREAGADAGKEHAIFEARHEARSVYGHHMHEVGAGGPLVSSAKAYEANVLGACLKVFSEFVVKEVHGERYNSFDVEVFMGSYLERKSPRDTRPITAVVSISHHLSDDRPVSFLVESELDIFDHRNASIETDVIFGESDTLYALSYLLSDVKRGYLTALGIDPADSGQIASLATAFLDDHASSSLAVRITAAADALEDLRINSLADTVEELRTIAADVEALEAPPPERVMDIVRDALTAIGDVFDAIDNSTSRQVVVAGAIAAIVGAVGWPAVVSSALILAAFKGKEAYMKALETVDFGKSDKR